MAEKRKNVRLNRAIFTQESFDSRSLTVLTTLIHRFQESGEYDVYIRSGRKPVRRLHTRVSAEHAEYQTDLDLASQSSESRACGCGAAQCYDLAVGGVMVFYVSQGTDRYSVRITKTDNEEEKKMTVLDSESALPGGDFFGVTLVRPGIYRVGTSDGKGEKRLRVSSPKGKPYRVDDAALVQVRKEGVFERRSVDLYPGQTVVFQLEAPASIQLRLEEADDRVQDTSGRGASGRKKSRPGGGKSR